MSKRVLPGPGRRLRVIGIDDAPFRRGEPQVNFSGVVCADTRFEGMIWGQCPRDSFSATEAIADAVLASKYHAQLHGLLLDGIALGGLSVVDLPDLCERIQRPCIAVMRRPPNLSALRRAVEQLPEAERRWSIIEAAGEIYAHPPFVYQCAGIDPGHALEMLQRCTDTGHVPEALRLAHLIGSAVKDGQSRGRA